MGWGNCGNDSLGRPIGYVWSALCDEPGCRAKIDRGLSHACGGMHGIGGVEVAGTEAGCELYFCARHLGVGGLCRSCLADIGAGVLIGDIALDLKDESVEIVNVCCQCGDLKPVCHEPTAGRWFRLIHVGCGGVVDQVAKENLPSSFPCVPAGWVSQDAT